MFVRIIGRGDVQQGVLDKDITDKRQGSRRWCLWGEATQGPLLARRDEFRGERAHIHDRLTSAARRKSYWIGALSSLRTARAPRPSMIVSTPATRKVYPFAR